MEEFNVKKFNRQKKIADFKRKAAEILEENKEVLVVAVPSAIGVIGKGISMLGRRANLNKEQNLKDRYIYDRSMGHYWQLKRNLKQSEWSEIERRKRAGEHMGDILNSMKILK